jgi:hypothetical protein
MDEIEEIKKTQWKMSQLKIHNLAYLIRQCFS